MSGIAKVIDELGLMIIAKNVELEDKQKEIDALKQRVESMEHYVSILERYIDTDNKIA